VAEFIPWFPDVLPQRLYEFALLALNSEPLPSYVSLIVASTLSVIFVAVAIWRFGREEY